MSTFGPFYRGPERIDLLYTILLCQSVDAKNHEAQEALGQNWGATQIQRLDRDPQDHPRAILIECPNYVFIVSESTQTALQWVQNVLRSRQDEFLSVPGAVHQFFATSARRFRDEWRAWLEEHLGDRTLVLCGFSLGASAVTILAEMLRENLAIEPPVFAFGSPRCGNEEWAEDSFIPDYVRVQWCLDPVASLPPVIWSKNGISNGWLPLDFLCHYVHKKPGYTITDEGGLDNSDPLPDFPTTVALLGVGDPVAQHNLQQYASQIRGRMPKFLEDGYGDYSEPGRMDTVAKELFDVAVWPWAYSSPTVAPVFEVPIIVLKGGGDVANMQCITYFRYGGQGWQEVVWWGGTFVNAAEALQALMAKRLLFLTKDCAIIGGRVRELKSKQRFGRVVPPPGYSVTTTGSWSDAPGKSSKLSTGSTTGNFGPNRIDDCIVVRMESDLKYARDVWCHGIPDEFILNGVLNPATQGVLDAQMAPYYAELVKFLIKVNDPVANAKQPVIAFANDPAVGNRIGFTVPTIAPFNVEPRQTVRLTGTGKPYMNGSWRVFSVSATGPGTQGIVYLIGSEQYTATSLHKGFLQPVQPTLAQVNRAAYNGLIDRKVGKAFDLRRGRASARVSHH